MERGRRVQASGPFEGYAGADASEASPLEMRFRAGHPGAVEVLDQCDAIHGIDGVPRTRLVEDDVALRVWLQQAGAWHGSGEHGPAAFESGVPCPIPYICPAAEGQCVARKVLPPPPSHGARNQ